MHLVMSSFFRVSKLVVLPCRLTDEALSFLFFAVAVALWSHRSLPRTQAPGQDIPDGVRITRASLEQVGSSSLVIVTCHIAQICSASLDPG